jgi:hypothetical protein
VNTRGASSDTSDAVAEQQFENVRELVSKIPTDNVPVLPDEVMSCLASSMKVAFPAGFVAWAFAAVLSLGVCCDRRLWTTQICVQRPLQRLWRCALDPRTLWECCQVTVTVQ